MSSRKEPIPPLHPPSSNSTRCAAAWPHQSSPSLSLHTKLRGRRTRSPPLQWHRQSAIADFASATDGSKRQRFESRGDQAVTACPTGLLGGLDLGGKDNSSAKRLNVHPKSNTESSRGLRQRPPHSLSPVTGPEPLCPSSSSLQRHKCDTVADAASEVTGLGRVPAVSALFPVVGFAHEVFGTTFPRRAW